MESRFYATGHKVRVEPVPHKSIPEFDPRSGDHFWFVSSIFKVNPEEALKGDSILDQENLMEIIGPGCFYCEQLYSPLLAKRRCKGGE